MALSRETMIQRMLASDAAYNGRFITGVLTTGIYCLPSCHARKPKPENVQFFKTGADARLAGLRPCKLCKPDEFESGIDTDLDRLEALATRIGDNPGQFDSVDALADQACVSVSTLHQQFREHFHSSPGTFLVRARIEAACRRLIETSDDVAQVGLWTGFDSTSGFYESFRKLTGMTPAAYRALSGKESFELTLPDGYNRAELVRALARDPQSVSERFEDNVYRVAFSVEGRTQRLTMAIGEGNVQCSTEGDEPVLAHEVASRLLNLRQDPANFERLAVEYGYQRLCEGREGMRIPLTPTPFEGLVWVIVGQQVNFRFAAVLRARVTEMVGIPIGDMVCMPEASAIAKLEPADLLRVQFSRQKADYLISCARLVADGSLKLDSLARTSATTAARTLTAVRGLGVWSVNYLMMRSLGFGDCVPLGDTGIRSGTRKLFGLDHEPKPEECDFLLKQFTTYRSLACYHLWRGF
jgi:AraC family transcriptional regulator of adaptative response / DNA-3-methyladenine glycosylase II